MAVATFVRAIHGICNEDGVESDLEYVLRPRLRLPSPTSPAPTFPAELASILTGAKWIVVKEAARRRQSTGVGADVPASFT
jgi:hypothetical protein